MCRLLGVLLLCGVGLGWVGVVVWLGVESVIGFVLW